MSLIILIVASSKSKPNATILCKKQIKYFDKLIIESNDGLLSRFY